MKRKNKWTELIQNSIKTSKVQQEESFDEICENINPEYIEYAQELSQTYDENVGRNYLKLVASKKYHEDEQE